MPLSLKSTTYLTPLSNWCNEEYSDYELPENELETVQDTVPSFEIVLNIGKSFIYVFKNRWNYRRFKQ